MDQKLAELGIDGNIRAEAMDMAAHHRLLRGLWLIRFAVAVKRPAQAGSLRARNKSSHKILPSRIHERS